MQFGFWKRNVYNVAEGNEGIVESLLVDLVVEPADEDCFGLFGWVCHFGIDFENLLMCESLGNCSFLCLSRAKVEVKVHKKKWIRGLNILSRLRRFEYGFENTAHVHRTITQPRRAKSCHRTIEDGRRYFTHPKLFL